MQKKNNGQNYAPVGKRVPCCGKGEFVFAATGLDHGHIYGMCNGLIEAGAELACVYDEDVGKVENFVKKYPGCKVCHSLSDLLEDPRIQLVAIASIPGDRAKIAVKCLQAGKHVFVDKPIAISIDEIDELEKLATLNRRRVFAYFSERLHVEAAVCAEKLISNGVIGRVINVTGFGPHRIDEKNRPQWFFDDRRFGGIITDIGCHQIEQIMFFSGASDASIDMSRIGNYSHKQYPYFQDYGDVSLTCNNGASGFFKVDWFTPDGLCAWGDGRTFITGEKGYIELRKYLDIGRDTEGDQVYYADENGEHHINASGKYGFPFFGRMIRDILDGSDLAMRQDYIFRVMRIAITAQNIARRIN